MLSIALKVGICSHALCLTSSAMSRDESLLSGAQLGSGESCIFCWGGAYRPPVISQTTGPISKIQTPFDSPVRELSTHGVKFDLEVTDNVTGQVKLRMFDFSGLVTSASTISMLNANKANE